RYKGARVFVDLGAERIIGAERQDEKIAVKIKSFVGPSVMQDLEGAVGQYVIYLSFLEQVEPERKLYIAISHPLSISAFQNEAVQMLVRRNHIALVVVDVVSEEVVQWMPI
ncbi:MAG: XisH protein, partial [Chloroflexota bacterium]|nr:XisH protein [Chloroflexota bacterium]